MKYITALLVLLSALSANASDINCQGHVTWIIDYPHKCDGNTAFKVTGSHGKWLCPASDKGNALVLTALAAGKNVRVYIDSQNGALTCSSLPHYTKARYVILDP